METATAPLEEQAAAITAPETKSPGIIEQAMAGLRSKAALNAEIAQLRGELQTAQARAEELETQVATLSQQVSAFTADHARLEAALQEAAEEKQTVDEAAAAKIASIGIAPAQLPAAQDAAEATVESLIAKMNATTDPAAKYALAAQINQLESGN